MPELAKRVAGSITTLRVQHIALGENVLNVSEQSARPGQTSYMSRDAAAALGTGNHHPYRTTPDAAASHKGPGRSAPTLNGTIEQLEVTIESTYVTMLRGRAWRASRLPSLGSALRGLDPRDSVLFGWFIRRGMDDPIRSLTTFSKNRDRLLTSDVAAFFDAVVDETWSAHLLSHEILQSTGCRSNRR
jgi:hypothetical protein